MGTSGADFSDFRVVTLRNEDERPFELCTEFPSEHELDQTLLFCLYETTWRENDQRHRPKKSHIALLERYSSRTLKTQTRIIAMLHVLLRPNATFHRSADSCGITCNTREDKHRGRHATQETHIRYTATLAVLHLQCTTHQVDPISGMIVLSW